MDPSRDHHTIAQAARRLGLTDDGVRKRIKRGQLGAYRVDGRTYVVLDGATAPPDSPNGPETVRHDNKTDTTALVARLEGEVAWLRAQLEHRDTLLALALQRPALPDTRRAENPTSSDSTRPWYHRWLTAWWRR